MLGLNLALSIWTAIRSWLPSSLFADNEQGVWYDPSDFSTMFQDSAGTTPVTAVEQPVGLMLDKSRGLVLGPELVVNGGFDTDLSGWSVVAPATAEWTSNGIRVSRNSGSFNWQAAAPISLVAGKSYKVSFSITSTPTAANGGLEIYTANRATARYLIANFRYPSIGTYSAVFTATITENALVMVGISGSMTGEVTLDNISVRELPGNHASQPTATSRPVVSARVNLLTKTEQFDDGVWAKSNVTVGGNKVIPNATSGQHFVGQGIAASGVTHTIVVKAKQAGYTWLKLVAFNQYANFDLSSGVVGANFSGVSRSISAAEDGSYICSFTFTSASSVSLQGCIIKVATADNASWDTANFSGNGTDGIDVYYADLRVANDGVGIPAYQRVNTATDYDSTGFPVYLRADGVDDGMVTNSIDFTATDKMTVVAGVRKLSDAVTGFLAELSTTVANAGTFGLQAPNTAGTYRFESGGSIPYAGVATASGYAAPITNVITGIGNISGDQSILRVDAIQAAINTGDQGAGTFGNYPLYLFRRGGSSLPFNGRFYGLTIVNKLLSTTELEQLETYVNGKTRAFA